jgi:hypothetical protein
MAFVHGKSGYIGVDNVATALQDISAYVTSVDGFPGEAAAHDVTTFGKNTVNRAAGLKDYKVTIQGIYDATVDAILAGIVGAIGTVTWRPAGAAGQQYTAEMLCTSYKLSNPVAGMIIWTANFEAGTGDIGDSTI